MRGARHLLALSLLGPAAGAAVLGAPAPALAVGRLPLDVLTGRLGEVDGRLGELEQALRTRPKEGSSAELAQRRLTDAQVLYTLRNYEAAATILFDLVDRYQKTPSYADALFYLADSLYLKRDHLASRRFFEKLVELQPPHPRYQEALERLVEISLHLQSFENTERWLERLAQVPREQALASVPYVRGKYYFIKKDYDKAREALSPILPQSPYYFQARYFLGAARVARGELQEALSEFLQVVQLKPRSDEEKRLLELSHLALGRIYYEQGQTSKAQEEYLQISQKSDLFPDALFESAWVAIKAKEYRRALRQLELLTLAQPDSLVIPEAKLLMGNLQIRVGDHAPATKWFEKTRAEFEPVQKRLDEILRGSEDPSAFFRDQIKKNLSKFDVGLVVPKPADRWLRADKDVGRFSSLATDVGELQRSLRETEDTVSRLEKALSGPQRYNVDPLLSQSRAGAVQLTGEIIGLRRQLADAMLGAVTPASSADELRQVADYAKRRGDLEKDVARVLAFAGSKSRGDAIRAQINEIDKRAAELLVHLEGLRKQRAAIEKYYAQTKKQQKIAPEQFERELREVTAQEEAVSQEHASLRKDLEAAMTQAGQEDQRIESDGQIQKDYSAAAQAEKELLNTLRLRLTGPERAQADQVWAALERTFTVDQRLSRFMVSVNQQLDVKLAEAQATLALERENVKAYRERLDACSGETEGVGGGLFADVLRQTAKRFYDIVVRSDIGIIDVAWAVKQQRTDRISRFVREQKRELKLLDDEFKEVLKE